MKSELTYGQVLPDKVCRCGGQLIYDDVYLVCADCFRIYCPSCHGQVVAAGGCFYCTECGWAACG
jgi:hypothetical protein